MSTDISNEEYQKLLSAKMNELSEMITADHAALTEKLETAFRDFHAPYCLNTGTAREKSCADSFVVVAMRALMFREKFASNLTTPNYLAVVVDLETEGAHTHSHTHEPAKDKDNNDEPGLHL